MYKMTMAALCGLAMAFAVGCGGAEETPQAAEYGELEVQVQGLTLGDTPEGIDKVTVLLMGPQMVTQDLVKNGSSWNTRLPKLLAGNYTAIVTAFAGAVSKFQSNPQIVTITVQQVAAVIFVLQEQQGTVQHNSPKFLSVSLDKMNPDQGEAVNLSVTISGGQGLRTLSGRHASLTPPAMPGTFEPSSVEFSNAGQATIAWVAPLNSGPMWFVLVVTDAAGNQAEVGIDVMVGPARGWLEADVRFNMAPDLSARTRVLNDNDAATFYIWITATDVDSIGMTYFWNYAGLPSETTNCNGRFLAGTETGMFGPSTVDAYFKYEVPNSQRDGACNLVLTAIDTDSGKAVLKLNLQDAVTVTYPPAQ